MFSILHSQAAEDSELEVHRRAQQEVRVPSESSLFSDVTSRMHREVL